MDSNNKVCRLCFGCNPQEFYNLNDGQPSYRSKVQECVPEVDVSIILEPIICVTCANMLDKAFHFRRVCLDVQARFAGYIRDKHTPETPTFYIMSHVLGPRKRHLAYHDIVDNDINFKMVIAIHALTKDVEALEKKIDPNILHMNAVEGDNRNGEELEMPNIKTELHSDGEMEVVPSDLLATTTSIPEPPPELDAGGGTTRTSVVTKRPRKHLCTLCLQWFRNLGSHMRIHRSNGRLHLLGKNEDKVSTVSEATYTSSTYLPPCWVRLERLEEDPLWCREVMCEVKQVHAQGGDLDVRKASRKRRKSMANVKSSAKLVRANVNRTLVPNEDDGYPEVPSPLEEQDGPDEQVNNNITDSATLSALSDCGENSDLDRICGCYSCGLLFENSYQLARHASFNHKNDNEKLGSAASSPSNALIHAILTEHSYVDRRAIQCWNCPRTFIGRELWAEHDYAVHGAAHIVCYVCLRAYRHRGIGAHLAHVHGYPTAPLRLKRRRPVAATPVSSDDAAFSVIAEFVNSNRLTDCPLCRRHCGSCSNLMAHLSLSKCNKAACSKCRATFGDTLHLLQHFMTEQHRMTRAGEEPDAANADYTCQVCLCVCKGRKVYIEHTCFSGGDLALYRTNYGLWECVDCKIISPVGAPAQEQHIQSALHLKNRLERLVNWIKEKNGVSTTTLDLSCHLCGDSLASAAHLAAHLASHAIHQTVVCPLCHEMALTPRDFTRHLRSQHAAAQLAPAQFAVKFTCGLCDREHADLAQYTSTCGCGHSESEERFTVEHVMRYLAAYEAGWLEADISWYRCDCNVKLQTGRFLYRHLAANHCNVWAHCNICKVLVTPRHQMSIHIKNKHKVNGKIDEKHEIEKQPENESDITNFDPIALDAEIDKEISLSLLDGSSRPTDQSLFGSVTSIQCAANDLSNGPVPIYAVKLPRLPAKGNGERSVVSQHISDAIERVVANITDEVTLPVLGGENIDVRQLPVLNREDIDDGQLAVLDREDIDDGQLQHFADSIMISDSGLIRDVQPPRTNTNHELDDIQLPKPFIEKIELDLYKPYNLSNTFSLSDTVSKAVKEDLEEITDDLQVFLTFPNGNEPYSELVNDNCRSHLDNMNITYCDQNITTQNGDRVEPKLESEEPVKYDVPEPVYLDQFSSETDYSSSTSTSDSSSSESDSNNEVGDIDEENDFLTAQKSLDNAIKDAVNSIMSVTQPKHDESKIKILYKCDKCNMITYSSAQLSEHNCKLTEVNIVSCLHCHKQFLNESTLQTHIAKEHSTNSRLGRIPRMSDNTSIVTLPTSKLIKCKLCSEMSDSMDALICHMQTHLTVYCLHCDTKVASTDLLNRHMEACTPAHHNRELNKRFFPKRSGDHTYDCSAASASLSPMRYNIFCCLDCDLILPGFYVAREHFVHLHSDAGALFSCEHCDALAVEPALIRQHKECHQRGAYRCIVCARVYATFDEYRVHYTGHRMAACPRCPRMFLDLSELRQHTAESHNAHA